MRSEEFMARFTLFCQMDTIPEISLGQMRAAKTEFMERVISREATEALGNAGRLLASWLDGALEYTVLKHEVIVLRMRSNKVHDQIKQLAALWPRKKQFIEGAYKVLLFTKNHRRQVSAAVDMLRGQGGLFDYREAMNRVLKRWYEARIREETERNERLKHLHDALTRLRDLRERQNEL